MQLSVACPAGPKNYEIMKLKAMDQYLDMWNLMAYDYAGSWDATSGYQANLYPSKENPSSTPFSTDAAIKYYTSHGVKASKIVLGMPLYGRTFLATDGPGKKYSEIGEGSYEKGIWDFKALPKDGAKEMIDKTIGASWSYDAGKKIMVTYDTKEMVQQKVEYIKKEGLGGGMWWESSADKKDGESLIGTVSLHSSPEILMLTMWLGRQRLGKFGQEPKHIAVPGQQVRQLEEGDAVSACPVLWKTRL